MVKEEIQAGSAWAADSMGAFMFWTLTAHLPAYRRPLQRPAHGYRHRYHRHQPPRLFSARSFLTLHT